MVMFSARSWVLTAAQATAPMTMTLSSTSPSTPSEPMILTMR